MEEEKKKKGGVIKKIIIGVLVVALLGAIFDGEDKNKNLETSVLNLTNEINNKTAEIQRLNNVIADLEEKLKNCETKITEEQKQETKIDKDQKSEEISEIEEEKDEIPETKEKEEEAKKLVMDIFMDKIIISKSDNDYIPDNNFTPDELSDYLENKGYAEETVKKATDFGWNSDFVAYHFYEYINDKSIEEIKKNLLDEKWLKDNNISNHAYTEEEVEYGEKLYEYYKEHKIFDWLLYWRRHFK